MSVSVNLNFAGSSVHLSPEEETNEIIAPDNTPTIKEGVKYYFLGKEVRDMSKRVICLTLCLVLVLSVFGTVASAQEDNEELSTNEKIQKYQDRLDNVLNELKSISKEIAEQSTLNDKKLAELQKKIENLRNSFRKLNDNVQEKVDHLESLKGLEEYKDKIMELAEEVSKLSNIVEGDRSRIVQMRKDVDESLKIVQDIKDQVPENTKRSINNRERTRKLESKVTSLNNRLETYSQRYTLIGVGAVALAVAVFFYYSAR